MGAWQPKPGMCPFRYPDDPLMFGAWQSLLGYAISTPALREAFKRDTGLTLFEPPKTGLDALIDQATGHTGDADKTLIAFIEWVNCTQWGEDEVSEHPLPIMSCEVA